MKPAAHSFRCPSCGREFLGSGSRPEAVTTCPYCAFNGELRQFLGSAAQQAAPAPPSGPAFAAQAPADYFPVPAHERPVPGARRRLLLGALSGALVLAAAAWLVWQDVISKHPEHSQPASTDSPPPENAASSAPPSPGAANAAQPLAEPGAGTVRSDGPAVFAQILTNHPQRLDFIHLGSRVRPRVEAFFTRHPALAPGPVEDLSLTPADLVTRQPVTLLRATTSANPADGALLRFHTGPDRTLRLDWPLFEETHDKLLNRYAAGELNAEPAWFTAGLQRSHGLEFPEASRASHHAFHLQGAPNIKASLPALVLRELPVGRYLDRQTEWRALYLGRLLLRPRQDAGGLRYLEILDCEGFSQNRAVMPPAATAPE